MTDIPMPYRKRPVQIMALQWDGSNGRTINDWTGGKFQTIKRGAVVYDQLHDTWISVKITDWIIRGVDGEFYPCDDSVFQRTYEPVEVNDGE